MYQTTTNKPLFAPPTTSLTNSSPNAATSSLNHPLYLISNASKTTSSLSATTPTHQTPTTTTTPSTRSLLSSTPTNLNPSLISCDPFSRNRLVQIPFSSFVVDLKGKRPKKRFKKPPEFRKVLPKNSLMLLHELRPNVEYR